MTHSLKKLRAIQQVSGQLYMALSRACTAHGDHYARFSLEAACEEYLVSFKMAYVATSHPGILQPDIPLASAITSAKSSTPINRLNQWPQESLWFEVESPSSTREIQATRQAEGLCVKLLASKSQYAHGKSLVVTLHDPDTCRHRVYLPEIRLSQQLATKTTTLADFRSSASTSHIGNIPQLHRLQIAKALATAVLQFHTTPWLTVT